MPIHPHLDRVELDVAYRASPEPQSLDLRVKTAGVADLPLAAWAVGTLVECINLGLAGGAEFSPAAGSAKLLSGPTGEGPELASERGPDLSFRLEVRAVSPRFLRTMVEYFAASGHPHALVGLTIVGSLAPDGSRLSARSPDVARWLDDPTAYVGAWASPGFRVTRRVAPRGASARVSLERDRAADVAAAVERSFSAWQSAVLTYPDLAGEGRGVMDPHCTFARTRTDVLARVSLFDHAPGPAFDALVNALTWVHERIAPLGEVEIALP